MRGVPTRRARTTESSVRVSIGRSWTRNRSAIAAQPLERVVVAVAIGSSERLPLVITSGGADVGAAADGAAASRGASRRARGVPGRDRRARPARSARRGASTIGRAGRVSSSMPRLVERDQRSRAAADDGAISANGLSSRCLRARSARDRSLVVRAAGEVEAAEALDRDDRAVAQRHAAARRVAGSCEPASRTSSAPRPAGRAGVRLGVEAAVAGSSYSARQRRAHREARHRRQRPVVGDAADDREPRAAVRAVDERVAVAAVGGVEQLAQAVVAGRACRA